MNKTKKILVGVLATLSVFAGSLGLAACNDTGSSSNVNEPTEIEKVYAEYVIYAQAEGQTPLSYEEWLETIKGEKGEQGEKGDTGAQGVGIEKVEYDENGNLLITFTDGTTQTVVMPEKEEHVHAFGEWTVFTADEVPCENRLFFHTCTECGTIEWKQGAYSDHDFTTVTTVPTCQAGGYDTKTCEICGKVEMVNPTGKVDHAWATEYSYNNSYHWFDCDTCDETKDKQEHTVLSSGKCSVCNALVGATEGIVYEVLADGTAQVVMYEGTATRVRIANTYQGAPVTKIANSAFEDSNLTSIVIPDSVTSIGDEAFYNCDSLTSVVIPDSVTSIGNRAFYDCDSLTSVVIGDSVTSIGSSAFYYCSSLTSIEIPDSVTFIGSQAFQGCRSLTSIEIPDSVTSIGDWAFANCSSLTSIEIPDSVTSIGVEAFYGCSSLQFNEYGNAKYLGSKTNDYFALIETKNKNFSSYTIHNDTKIIADYAFYNCSSLTSIEIPDSVTSIGDYAFYYCSGLTSVVIGDSVTSIGGFAFEYCSSLQFNEYGNAKYLGSKTNDYFALIGTKSKNFSSYTIHNDTKIIAGCAFYECNSLMSVVIGDSVTSIGYGAFEDCDSLTSVVIGDSVTSIGEYAFLYCSSLTSVVIGDSVTSIGMSAFYYCSSLTSAYYNGTAEDWANIVIDDYNYKLTSAKRYYYSEKEPQVAGNFWHYDESGNIVVW